jgi:uncharacterized protein YcfJ
MGDTTKEPAMNKPLFVLGLAGLSLASPGLRAQDMARVISSIPVIQQVAVPRQVCTTQQVLVDPPKSGAGAAMGAIAGGALGNQIGRGDGRTAATLAGVIGGAMLGNRIEGQPAPQVRDQTTCGTQTVYETRTIGYDVTYEYAGRQYRVQSPQDPGPYLRVEVTPVLPQPAAPGALPLRPISAMPSGTVVAAYPGPAAAAYPPPGMPQPWGWHRHHRDWR